MFKNKEEFKFEFSRRIIESYGRTVEEAHITEKFMVLETMVEIMHQLTGQQVKLLFKIMNKTNALFLNGIFNGKIIS